MYVNTNGDIVHDADPYKGLDGISYPKNFPKGEIPELSLVTEVARPAETTHKVTGYTVDGSNNQVWTTEAKTQAELDADTNNDLKGQISAIEATITQRRIRDAILGTDGGWLSTQETAIAALRVQLV